MSRGITRIEIVFAVVMVAFGAFCLLVSVRPRTLPHVTVSWQSPEGWVTEIVEWHGQYNGVACFVRLRTQGDAVRLPREEITTTMWTMYN